jgi:putative glycosyltransferase
MKLSVVTTLYKSENYVKEFFERVSTIAHNLVGHEFEIIFVNDGSPDCSLGIASEISENEPRVTTINLARNYGHHRAIMVGLEHAIGDDIFLIDSDLEEKPEWLESFYEYKKTQSVDVVYGVQTNRKGGLFEKLTVFLFWKLISLLSGEKIQANQVTARLMSKKFVQQLIKHKESELFFGGICHITGFNQKFINVQKGDNSPTTYSISKKVNLVVSSVTSFSTFPLNFIFYTGLAISSISLFFGMYLIVIFLFFQKPIAGFTSIMVSIWFLLGLVILFMGIIATYIGKIFIETKSRPIIIRNIFRGKNID